MRGSLSPPDLRAAALNCLTQVSSHNEELANQVRRRMVGVIKRFLWGMIEHAGYHITRMTSIFADLIISLH